MAAFFDKIVHMSLAASLVILLVLPVRRGLRRAPKAFSYLLWAAVLFRLLCPVAVCRPGRSGGGRDRAGPAVLPDRRV